MELSDPRHLTYGACHAVSALCWALGPERSLRLHDTLSRAQPRDPLTTWLCVAIMAAQSLYALSEWPALGERLDSRPGRQPPQAPWARSWIGWGFARPGRSTTPCSREATTRICATCGKPPSVSSRPPRPTPLEEGPRPGERSPLYIADPGTSSTC